jgi:hypothetical protein
MAVVTNDNFKGLRERKLKKNLGEIILPLSLHSQRKREHSSAGLEHLPYKQRVRGSIPCAPTQF